MLITCDRLRDTPRVFRSMTGLTVAEFDALLAAVLPRLGAAERARQERAGRRRAPGAGHPHGLPPRDRVLLTVIWLRHDLARDVLGCLFGVSGTTAARVVARVLPLLVGTPADPKRGRSASSRRLRRPWPRRSACPTRGRPSDCRSSGRGLNQRWIATGMPK